MSPISPNMNQHHSQHSQLTSEIKDNLIEGSRVEFKWYGSPKLYTGRIEVAPNGVLYFVNEHNYKGDILIEESMRYYNPLESFFCFTYFKHIS